MPYTTYPAVDDNYEFPPEVVEALLTSPEFIAAVIANAPSGGGGGGSTPNNEAYYTSSWPADPNPTGVTFWYSTKSVSATRPTAMKTGDVWIGLGTASL